MNELKLDERLEADTLPVAELPLCRLLLMNDARFTWIVLVPRRPQVSEVFELSHSEQQQLWHEATILGKAMKTACGGDKVNIASLGNVVSQLHVHVVIRKQDDAAWPAPVWGHGTPLPYDLDGQADMRALLLAQIDGIDFATPNFSL
ncbi:HIT family protein [Halomonas sp. Bachu 37]|uniref:HIT family protein n=1 Tax=Halomonas kashgarensis TaxID=3084920 RepID=UPI0032171E63